jgi:serine/threonine protein kinase
MDAFTKSEKLGEGTYGIVYRAIETSTGEVVALKQMRIEQEEEGVPVTALREVALIRNLVHPNIVRLKDVILAKGSLTLVTEYLDYDLRKYLDSLHRGLPPALLKSYAFQLLCGLCYLHSNRIMHRDIKPQNLLINKEGHLKICDFGLARMFALQPRQYTHEVVTLWYRPPELLMGCLEYDISVDVWGAGCIIAEMITGSPLFGGDSEIDQLHRIFRALGTPTEITWPGFQTMPNFSPTFPTMAPQRLQTVLQTGDALLVDLIGQLVQINPQRRISALRALSHPYFAGVPRKLINLCVPQGVQLEFPRV